MAGKTIQMVRFDVSGMGCGGCAASIEGLLKQAQGVHQVTVSFTEHEARIEYDPAQIKPNQLAALLEEAGYTVTERLNAVSTA
jgi:copper chaperone CopZ